MAALGRVIRGSPKHIPATLGGERAVAMTYDSLLTS